MRAPPPPEAVIARIVIDWLEALGADVYQEVELSGGRADIVARVRRELWIVETKSRMSLELVEQALDRRRHATRVYIAAPLRRARAGRSICAELGIGLLGVEPAVEPAADAPAWRRYTEPARVDEVCDSARWNRRPAALAALLAPEHKTHARAGAPTGGHWTRYRATVEALARFVAAHPGCTLKTAIAGISHHYRSTASARAALAHWIASGKVPGVALRAGALYPAEPVH